MPDAIQILITELEEYVESLMAQPVKVKVATMVAAFQEIETGISPVVTAQTRNTVYAGPASGAPADSPAFSRTCPAVLAEHHRRRPGRRLC